MEEYNKDAWEELIERCEEAGVDAFEINFSCPHGMPERRMGMAMGQDCDLLEVLSNTELPMCRPSGFAGQCQVGPELVLDHKGNPQRPADCGPLPNVDSKASRWPSWRSSSHSLPITQWDSVF